MEHLCLGSLIYNADLLTSGTLRSSELCPFHPKASVWMGRVSRDGGNQKDTVSEINKLDSSFIDKFRRIRILTEIEPDW